MSESRVTVSLPVDVYGCFNCGDVNRTTLVPHRRDGRCIAILVVCQVCIAAVEDATLRVALEPWVEVAE